MLAKSNENIKLTRFCSMPKGQDELGSDYEWLGRVDLDKCNARKALFLNIDTTRYYVCGPSSFMVDMEEQLRQLDIKSDRIWLEHFGVGEI